MALVFSPLSVDIMSLTPKKLYPGQGFVMRQIGKPPAIDMRMAELVAEVFQAHNIATIDADASTGGGDFLERIIGLIRATGFTVAIFSHLTRPSAMANITLELGFAAVCGKPLIIVKSAKARAPSDLSRTDWVQYDPGDEERFRAKLEQSLETNVEAGDYEEVLLDTALAARTIDCAVALERASKAFLLTGKAAVIDKAEEIMVRLKAAGDLPAISDLDRLRGELALFLHLARASLNSAPA